MSLLTRCALSRPQGFPPSFLLPALLPLQFFRNASHATERQANQKSTSPGKRLGAKRAATELVVPGTIIFRQRGTHWFPGENCRMGRDHTIFAKEKGYVVYYREKWRNLKGERKFIGIVFTRDQTLPRPPGAKRMRRLGLIGRDREDVSEVSEGAEASSKQPASSAQARVVDATRVGKESATSMMLPRRSRQQRRRTPNSQLRLRSGGYQYRESNTSIGRVAERMGVKPIPFDKRDRRAVWKRNIAARAKLREATLLSSKKTKGGAKTGKGAKAQKGKGKK